MNLSHIFQKEMPTDDNNIFLLNSPKTIKWKKFLLKKTKTTWLLACL